ncbi:MAG: hypothetical protein PVJ49_12765 [Acidobacteriota bacterium]|jgi:hypothetical protein
MKPAHLRAAPRSAAKGILVAVLTLGLVPASVAAAPHAPPVPQRPDFSGTWRLDPAASEIVAEEGLAGLGGAAPEWLHITQARNGALILSSRVNGAQPRFYMIGGENELPAPGGELERMTIATAWDGDSLVSTGSTEYEGAPYEVREVMSRSADGATLRLQVTTRRGEQTITNLLVYEAAAGG